MVLRVLLVGNGGREHALARKLSESPLVEHIYAVPGNGGTALEAKTENVASIAQNDFAGLLRFAVESNVNLLVPGPEAPLVDGIADYFRDNGPARIACFGPSKAAARMEGSKEFAKSFMKRHNIPTAAYESFTDFDKAKAYLEANRGKRFVIKADGLAAGKGVMMPQTHDEGVAALEATMVQRAFGAAGSSVVVEEFLEGEEISILSFCDGYSIASLPAAQDHKRINDGDEGLNTGGMGCYAPTGIAPPAVMKQIHETVLQPTIDGMRREGYPMIGCLFTGLMLTASGPKVLEYNTRFGDPETQTLLPLMDNDLAGIMTHCTNHTLDAVTLSVKPQSSVTVVVAAGGYPEAYDKNLPMTLAQTPSDVVLYHAGTTMDSDGKTVKTSGGRVIACTALGADIKTAVDKSYSGLRQCIKFDKMHFRTDIARRELQRPQAVQEAMTYAAAGVSIDAGNDFVKRIKTLVASTARPGADASIGGFGGLLDLSGAGFGKDAPYLVFGIDGIGTKIQISLAMQKFDTVGQDLVAMNVNDIVVQGAEPVSFLDYYATGKLDVEHATDFVKGVVDGCRAAGCALVGGETAEMAGMYQGGEFDAAGCAIGVLPKSVAALPHKTAMQADDVLLGLASSGPHSNGYTLIRKLVSKSGLGYGDAAPWATDGRTLGAELLTPTRIYVRSLLEALKMHAGAIRGMAHVTGGGITDNVPRMLPTHLAARVQVGNWPLPAVFQWFKRVGAVENRELARTFNCGVGMVVAVDRARVDEVKATLRQGGETVFDMGSLVARPQGNEGVVYEGLEAWDVAS